MITGRNETKEDRINKGSRKSAFPLYVDYFVSLTQNYTIPVFLAVQFPCMFTSQYQYDSTDTVHEVQIS
jgi:hypothetical protein